MIEVSHLYKSFDSHVVLQDVNFNVEDGEILAILGESGTGKSVLLKHLIGLIKPDSGTITIDGTEITTLSEKKLLPIRKMIGYLFQEGALYDFMSVFDNLAFPLREHTDLTEKAIKEKVLNTLKIVDLNDVENKFPSELSGGMKKRVGLARAVIMDTKFLFCDEPTSGLDPIRSRDISELIVNVSRQMKCTTIITSHDIKNSFHVADRLALLHEGKVVIMGTDQELKASKNSFVQSFIS